MRQLLRDLASPRYAALSLLMVLVALICVVAGTWQISRYDGKHLANDDLRGNARDTVTAVADVLPVVGDGPAPSADDVEFRTVRATGSYDAAAQLLVRRVQVDDRNGYFVLTPLRTSDAVLLVVRGFVDDTDSSLRPADVPAPPGGEVTVTARVQASDTGNDEFAALDNGQVNTVNVPAAAARLGTAVYEGYVELEAGQPGTSGLVPLPAPDLSNPAGGAFEWQHLAYIVQWYLFAVLALAAPAVMVRVDRNRAREDARAEAQTIAAVAARAQQAALTAPPAGGDAHALVRLDDEQQAQAREQAKEQARAKAAAAARRLADRYGR